MVCSASISSSSAVLDDEHAEHPSAAQDRHAHQRVEDLFAGLGLVRKIRMRLRIGQRQRMRVRGDVADKAFADRQPGLVHGLLLEAFRREQLQDVSRSRHVDGADLGHHVGRDDANGLVQPLLPRHVAGHQIAKALEQAA